MHAAAGIVNTKSNTNINAAIISISPQVLLQANK
jgi:hypothetical protein